MNRYTLDFWIHSGLVALVVVVVYWITQFFSC